MKQCLACRATSGFIPFKKGQYDLFLCSECGLIFLYPQPSAKELVSEFYSAKSGYHAALPHTLDTLEQHNKKFLAVLETLDQIAEKGNILDVGCANGEFLFFAKKRGFTPYGVEVNKSTADIAVRNGFTVFQGTLEEAKFQDNFFSVIYLGDVLEHVTDPKALLTECHRILKEGGILTVATPNANCFFVGSTRLFHQWLKFPWPVLIPPYHVFIFSDKNIEKLLSVASFTKISVRYLPPKLYHELASTGLVKEIREQGSVFKILYAFLVFSSYSLLYLVNMVLRIFIRKDFRMIVFAKKI